VAKVAVVIGASQGGTGTATAIRLAAEGAKVAIVARSADKLADVLRDVEAVSGPGRSAMFTCDVGDPLGGRATLVARTEEALGPIDYLVYVAAGGRYLPFLDVTEDDLQLALEVNVKAPWLLVQDTVASLRGRGAPGAVVNIGTKAAYPFDGPPFVRTPFVRKGSLYGGTKAALHRFTQSVAAEVYGDGIAVNMLAPVAAIGTPALRASGWIPEEMLEPVEAMAEAVLALLTGDPTSMTARDVYSIELLDELGRPVLDRLGRAPVQGWGLDDLPVYLQARSTPVPLTTEGQLS
jgi:NAD(P)-dependent dehydrogenase (short-subunit alcohol dehydrogenase family)